VGVQAGNRLKSGRESFALKSANIGCAVDQTYFGRINPEGLLKWLPPHTKNDCRITVGGRAGGFNSSTSSHIQYIMYKKCTNSSTRACGRFTSTAHVSPYPYLSFGSWLCINVHICGQSGLGLLSHKLL
jgi:hypothetical protein